MGYFCSVSIYKLPLKKPWRLCWSYIMADVMAVRLHYGWVLWINHKRREYSMSAAATAAALAQRE